MKRFATKKELLEQIDRARLSAERMEELRRFVFGYYVDDVEYAFECEDVEWAFAVLGRYLEFEEAQMDENRSRRLLGVFRALSKEDHWTLEKLVAAVDHPEIAVLIRKLQGGAISRPVFEEQMRKLWSAPFNWLQVLDFYNQHPEYWRSDLPNDQGGGGE